MSKGKLQIQHGPKQILLHLPEILPPFCLTNSALDAFRLLEAMKIFFNNHESKAKNDQHIKMTA